MTRAAPRRKLIGQAPTLVEWVKVYRTDQALEIDYATSFEISRRRVFFDEIVLVLLHRRRSPLVKLIGVLVLAAGIAVGLLERAVVLFPVGLLLGSLLFFAASSWTVTAFGRRTVARMRYGVRQQKARAVFDDICRRAAQAQSELGARIAAGRTAIEPAVDTEPWPAPPPPASPPDDGTVR